MLEYCNPLIVTIGNHTVHSRPYKAFNIVFTILCGGTCFKNHTLGGNMIFCLGVLKLV